jgi:hypothetical protein
VVEVQLRTDSLHLGLRRNTLWARTFGVDRDIQV